MSVTAQPVFLEPDYSKNPTFFRFPNPHQCAWFKYFIGTVQFTRCRFAQILVLYRRNGIELPWGTFRVESADLAKHIDARWVSTPVGRAYYAERKRRRVERVKLRAILKGLA